MNKQELQNKISELEETLWHLQEELEDMEEQEAEKGKIWKPADDETYWYVDMDGEICKSASIRMCFDTYTINFGNCYPTKEKAEFEANREKYTRLFRQYVEQHSEPLNWKDVYQEKWYCEYSNRENYIDFRNTPTWQEPFQIYASSEKVLQEAIDFIGEKNFLEFVMEVKEN